MFFSTLSGLAKIGQAVQTRGAQREPVLCSDMQSAQMLHSKCVEFCFFDHLAATFVLNFPFLFSPGGNVKWSSANEAVSPGKNIFCFILCCLPEKKAEALSSHGLCWGSRGTGKWKKMERLQMVIKAYELLPVESSAFIRSLAFFFPNLCPVCFGRCCVCVSAQGDVLCWHPAPLSCQCLNWSL